MALLPEKKVKQSAASEQLISWGGKEKKMTGKGAVPIALCHLEVFQVTDFQREKLKKKGVTFGKQGVVSFWVAVEVCQTTIKIRSKETRKGKPKWTMGTGLLTETTATARSNARRTRKKRIQEGGGNRNLSRVQETIQRAAFKKV